MTHARLYGRRRIVEYVRDALRRDGVPAEPLPVVLLAGPPGAGGTAVLGRLWEEFAADVLSVRLDLEPADSVPDIVLAAMRGLGRRIPGIRPIDFPRLRTAFKALSFVDEDGARADFDGYLRAGHRDAAVRSALDEWGERAAPLLSNVEHQFLMTAGVRALGGLLGAVGRHGDDRIPRWFAGNGVSRGGTGNDPLWELHGWHHEGTESGTRKVARTLCAALLADLRADFNSTGLLRGQRVSHCLLLLDNTDGPAAGLFLELLADARRDAARAGEAADPAVVVAARHGRPHPDRGAPLDATDERLRFAVRHPAAGDDDHPARWYPVRLTDLGERDVVELTRSGALGSGGRDAGFLYALTGGHPEAADRLAVLLNLFGRDPFDPRRLLETPLPDAHRLPDHWPPAGPADRSVEEYLLSRAFPGPAAGRPGGDRDPARPAPLDAMAVLAATPGLRKSAFAAALRYLHWDGFEADEVQERLVSAMWLAEDQDGEAGRLHPLVRLLLVRRLARDRAAWQPAHRGYRAHYAHLGDTVLHQYHSLALVEPGETGALAGVVGFLDTEFDGPGSKAAWVALLERITAAPNRLRHEGDVRDFAAGLAGTVAPGDDSARGARLRGVARLVLGHWLGGDRCFDPAHRLAQTVATEYRNLANLCTGDGEVLFRQAAKYRRVEKDWE